MELALSERLGEECWLLGVLTEGPTGAPRNSFSRDESPLHYPSLAGETLGCERGRRLGNGEGVRVVCACLRLGGRQG